MSTEPSAAWLTIPQSGRDWSTGKLFLLWIAAVVPFGTFVADRKLLA